MALTRIDSYLVDLDSLGGITFDDQAGTPTFKVDAVNHRVGIGTASPATSLHVYNGSTNRVLLLESGDEDVSIAFKDSGTTSDLSTRISAISNDLLISTSFAERLRITSTGNVGIGTTNPGYKLHVQDGSIFSSSSVVAGTAFNIANVSGSIGGSGGTENWIGLKHGTTFGLVLKTAGSNVGNVGIGTTNPLYKVDVSDGNIRARHGNLAGAELGGHPTQETSFVKWAADNHHGIWFRGSVDSGGGTVTASDVTTFREYGQFEFWTGGPNMSQRLVITSSGNVGIGTTNPYQKLDVAGYVSINNSNRIAETNTPLFVQTQGVANAGDNAGAASPAFLRIMDRGANNLYYHGIDIRSRRSGDVRILNHDQGTNLSDLVFALDDGSVITERFRIKGSSGNVGIGTTNPDRTLFINGQTRLGGGLDYGLTDVLSVAPGTINFDAPGLAGGRLKITSTGNVGINTTNPASKLHIIGSISSGTETEPQLVVRDAGGAMRAFEFYFSVNKPTAVGTSVNVTLVSVSSLGNFHQAAFTVEYGTRLQGVSDATTSVCMKQYGVNRFVGNNVAVTDTNDIASDTNSNNHANVTCVATASDSYVIRIEFSSSVASSTFCSGVIRGWGVADSWGSNISFFNGSGN